MSRNILILCGPQGAAEFAASLAAESGDDLGLVRTGIDPTDVRRSGCRIEQDRPYGGRTLSTFDEPLSVGSAVAQLAGHADAIIIDSLDDWALRLVANLEQDAVASEITSVESVMSAQLADVLLISRPVGAVTGPAASVHRTLMELLEPLCHTVVDHSEGEPTLVKGRLSA